MPVSIANGLRIRGIDVLTAYEDGRHELDDSSLLDRAVELNRVMFSRDDDLVIEAASRLAKGSDFTGVIYVHQLKLSIGAIIDELELIATASSHEELRNTISFLPV